MKVKNNILNAGKVFLLVCAGLLILSTAEYVHKAESTKDLCINAEVTIEKEASASFTIGSKECIPAERK